MPIVTKVFTLSAGNNRLSTMLASVSSDISMLLTYLRWRVVGPGDVAKGDSSMAALTDGDLFSVGEGDTAEAPAQGDCIEATKIYFRPTTGGVDKIFIEARSR